MRRLFPSLPTPVLAGALLTGVLMTLALRPGPAGAQALSGQDLFRSNCEGCHPLPDPDDEKYQQFKRADWEKVLKEMVEVRGATLNQREFTAVLNYLDSFNRPAREIHWVQTPAASHQVAPKPADAGKLPGGWVDLTVGGDELVPWAVQTDAAGKTAFFAPLREAPASQLPLLLDNSGIFRSGTLAARVQLVSGKGAAAAGIVFGYRSPQQFYGVRLSPADAILYEVRGGERALLARTPLALPLKQWHALKVDVTGKEAKVTLNGQPVPQLTRTLPAYQGGHAGLATQGDTRALFDQWQVTVK